MTFGDLKSNSWWDIVVSLICPEWDLINSGIF
jgi:hypothetical protein